MIINIEEVSKPFYKEFTLFADVDLNVLKETKTIYISNSFRTKTRISTSMQIGKSCHSINFNIDGYKYHHELSYSFATGNHRDSYYYVVSKNQNFETYKEYVSKLIEYVINSILKIELEEVNIKLERF